MNVERYHYHLVKTSTAGRYSKRKTDFVKTISIKCVHTRRTQNIVAPSYQLLHNNNIIISCLRPYSVPYGPWRRYAFWKARRKALDCHLTVTKQCKTPHQHINTSGQSIGSPTLLVLWSAPGTTSLASTRTRTLNRDTSRQSNHRSSRHGPDSISHLS